MLSIRVLVVDADHAAAAQTVEVLDRHVECVTTAPDAYQALARLAVESFQVVVTELALPGASGFDLLERLDRDLAAVAVTALYSSHTALLARRAGAHAVLEKPADERLVEALARVLAASIPIPAAPVPARAGIG